MCFQPFDVNSFAFKNGAFTLTNGDIELTCKAGTSWFGGKDNLEGRVTEKVKGGKAKGLDGVVIKFYKPVEEGKKGDFQDDRGEWWVYMGETKTENGDYSFDDPDDNPTAGNTYYVQCDYVEGSGVA